MTPYRVVCFLLTLVCSQLAAAQDFQVNLNKLISQTQLVSEDPDRMRLVWWIPEEYWVASLAHDPATASEAQRIIATLKDYSVFAIADGAIDGLGGVVYVEQTELEKNLSIIGSNGDKIKPLSQKKINEEAKAFLGMMKPVFAGLAGPFGENMHFVLFSNENPEGDRLLDPMKEGGFTVQLFNESLKWELPLGSLFKPKTCPLDQAQWDGTWKFCPKHGEELVD